MQWRQVCPLQRKIDGQDKLSARGQTCAQETAQSWLSRDAQVDRSRFLIAKASYAPRNICMTLARMRP